MRHIPQPTVVNLSTVTPDDLPAADRYRITFHRPGIDYTGLTTTRKTAAGAISAAKRMVANTSTPPHTVRITPAHDADARMSRGLSFRLRYHYRNDQAVTVRQDVRDPGRI